MGGASSDAATTLRGLASLYHINTDLNAIASQLGADVPFFLSGGTAIAEHRGDHLTRVPTKHQWFAIAWPEFELSTQDVYRAWDTMPGKMPNQLMQAALSLEPRLSDFAYDLGPTWQMTGSGSAFFRLCSNEQEAGNAIANVKCWTAIAQAIGPWAE
jgi:4-diphosphocytidyl-2C-methyl-D-erythritol kinase